jgi:hypothetical protein
VLLEVLVLLGVGGLALVAFASQVRVYSLSDLEGAWWPEGESPTAEFAILGDEIWLDDDSDYHPCRIEDRDTLLYDPGPGRGVIERRIVLLEADTLVLESTAGGETNQATYTRR